MRLKATDLGPVKLAEIELHPGLNLLRGANGSGKSTILNAVNYALTKTGPKPSPRDGVKAGRIEVFGISVTFGARTTAKGTLEVRSITGDLDIGELIVNQFEDDAVTDKWRIRKLISLSGAQATAEMFAPLVGDSAEFIQEGMDLLDASDECKKYLQENAREEEAAAENYARRKAAAMTAAEGVDITVETDAATLQEAHVQVASQVAFLQRQQTENARRIQEAAEARAKLETEKAKPAPTKSQALAAVEAAERIATHRAAEVDEAERRLVAAREALKAARIGQGVARDRYEQANRRAEAMAAWESQVSAAESLQPIPDSAIAEARAAADAARKAIEAGALARRALKQLAAAEDFADAERHHAAKAAELRRNATRTDDVLAAELQRIGCPWYPVEVPAGNGTERRLATKHAKRGETLVSELSDGERARDAIDVALALAGKSERPAVLILRQEQFEGLQPKVRAEIDQHAQERGVVILTAAASDDEEVTV